VFFAQSAPKLRPIKVAGKTSVSVVRFVAEDSDRVLAGASLSLSDIRYNHGK